MMKELKQLEELIKTIHTLYTKYEDIGLLIELGYEDTFIRGVRFL